MGFKNHTRDYFKLLLAGFSFSTLAIFSQIATNLSIDGFNQIVWRSLFAVFVSGILAFFVFREKISIKNTDLKYLVINGILYVGGISTFTLGIYLGSPIAKAVAPS
jgi:drug/metabolite transporter (DMT)-like permease